MKITNRQSCKFTPPPFFCFFLTSVFGLMFLSGREPPLTDERADISGILRLFYTDECDEASGSVYGFYLLLTLLSWSPAAKKPVALKEKKKRKGGGGGSSRTRNESGNSYLALLRSTVMSLSQIRLAGVGARTARTYRQRGVTRERASRRGGQFKIDLPQPKD